MFKAKGIIKYDPVSDKSSFLRWTAIVQVNESIAHYYRYWVKRELGTHLNATIWKSHITIVRGEQPKRPLAWNKHAGREVEFTYEPYVYNSNIYFWLRIKCGTLSSIRDELGLAPKPKVDFHLTIGNLKNVDQAKVKPLILPKKLFPWEREEYFNRNY